MELLTCDLLRLVCWFVVLREPVIAFVFALSLPWLGLLYSLLE